jgi:VWFA-related protein
MTIPALLCLALQAPVGTPAEARTITVSVTDEKGVPVTGLRTDEVAVLENGVARHVSQIQPETRPLTVAVIVDSSEPIGALYRLNVVVAVARFVSRLPEGSRYALWTTGDRPTKLVDFTDDVTRAGAALKQTFPRGGNTLLDALVEASDDLNRREGERTALVVVTGNGAGFTNHDRNQVVDRVLKNGHTVMAVNFQEGAEPGDLAPGPSDDMGQVGRADYDFVLGILAERSGGLREIPLSAMGVDRPLEKIAAALASQYRITYGTLPDLKDRKIKVTVARPRVKVSLVGSRP